MTPPQSGTVNDAPIAEHHAPDPVEPIVKWLFGFIMVLVFVLVGLDKLDRENQAIFQVIANLLSFFSGVLGSQIVPRWRRQGGSALTPAPGNGHPMLGNGPPPTAKP
jgi:hypothetical protein